MNMGLAPNVMSTSFVDDGICDCCDGSDEPRGTCRNTCLAHTRSRIDGVKQREQEVRRGLDLKAEMARQGTAKRAELGEQLRKTEEEMAGKQGLLPSLTSKWHYCPLLHDTL